MRKEVKQRLDRLLAEMERLALPLPEEGRDERVARGKIDDQFFFQTYLPHIFRLESAEFHRDLCQLFDLRGSPSVCAVHAPRGFGKTPVFSQGKPIQSLCYGTHREILAVSATSDIADELTAPIAQELKNNPRILQDFGPLITSGGATRFETSLGAKFWAVGRRSAIRGYHPDLAILDDIEDDKQAYNADRVAEVIEWIDNVVIPAMKPESDGGSNLILSGTIICTASVLDLMLQREAIPAGRRRIYKALHEDELGNLTSLWEVRRPVHDLLNMKAMIGSRAFDSEFQGEPHDDDRMFPPEWFLPFSEEEFQQAKAQGPTTDILFYDPAARDTKKHDYKAIVLLSLASNGIAYVRDAWIRQSSVDTVVDKTFANAKAYPEAQQWYEANGFQVLYEKVFELKAPNYEHKVTLEQYTTTQNKKLMIEGLSGFVENGRIRFKQNADGSWFGDIKLLLDQLKNFPNGKHDDGPDALSKAHAVALDKSKKAACQVSRKTKKDRHAEKRGGFRRMFDALRSRR